MGTDGQIQSPPEGCVAGEAKTVCQYPCPGSVWLESNTQSIKKPFQVQLLGHLRSSAPLRGHPSPWSARTAGTATTPRPTFCAGSHTATI